MALWEMVICGLAMRSLERMPPLLHLLMLWQCSTTAEDFSYPLAVRGATIFLVACGGALVAAGFSAALGDATWSVSTGLGSCLVAAIYEVGRPDRLSVDEANVLEEQYQDFGIPPPRQASPIPCFPAKCAQSRAASPLFARQPASACSAKAAKTFFPSSCELLVSCRLLCADWNSSHSKAAKTTHCTICFKRRCGVIEALTQTPVLCPSSSAASASSDPSGSTLPPPPHVPLRNKLIVHT